MLPPVCIPNELRPFIADIPSDGAKPKAQQAKPVPQQVYPMDKDHLTEELQHHAFLNRELEHRGEELFEMLKDYIRAWHVLHGVPWDLGGDIDIDTLFKAAISLTPPSSKKPKHNPYTIPLILAIHENLDLDSPLNIAAFACLTTMFFTYTFDPLCHVKPSDFSKTHNHQGLQMMNFRIPHTKASIEGEDVFWASQLSPANPQEALNNHFSVNEPPQDGTHHPLTKTCFLKRLAIATKAAGHKPLQGHRI
ncbi:hypothetical protein DEU56DRAFT_908934 [Suillus clintonianus]|uniref:uncharacterized protein n=1 Tax=Suillus clintonianus TaxID=1904413 RepID=UPI001B872B8E|nr:uncharacterized protein DEU56DRAFT_908934 [Suillus clintonianus]KAG2149235.1 hypothetical protein DEU56DRAFT_908934 [Suillus clintonianus]